MIFKSLLISSFFISSLIFAEPINTGHAEVSLVKNTQISPNGIVHIGIKMDMQEGWHTYWLNPGDSGGAIDIEWILSDESNVSDVIYPTPHRIPYPPLMTFGYEDQVIFPVDLAVKDLNKDIDITANINFLICADVCIPESAVIKTTLNTIAEDVNLSKWRDQVPSILLPNISSVNENYLELRFSYNKKIDDIYFFPIEENMFIYNPTQDLIREENNWLLKVPLLKGITKNISGVLVINDESYIVKTDLNKNLLPQNLSNFGSITIWQALIFAFIGGLILNIMPCVFPIISLKALSFVSMGGGSSNKVRLHALNFCFGVITSFVAIALAIVFLQKTGSMVGWGFQLQSPPVVALLAILMFIIGLVLLMDINIGTSMTRLGAVGANNTTYLSSFMTGVLAVIVASPCTAPFMGAAIGYALIQPSSITVPIFLSLGIGFSLPYLILATFPQLITKIPKPGEWMNTLKEFFAFPMFATALWLLWVFSIQTSIEILISLLICILIISILFWFASKVKSKNIHITTFLFGLIIVLIELNFINKENAAKAEIANDIVSVGWDVNTEDELKKIDQAYLINFTAAWCITCQANDKLALSRPVVKKYLAENNIKYIVADWTNRDDNILKVLKEYGRTGVPLYLYWKPGLEETVILPAILTEDILINLL